MDPQGIPTQLTRQEVQFAAGDPADDLWHVVNLDVAPALAGVNGLPATFLRLGASSVVAALWSVKDNLAHQVAQTFYDAVLQHPEIPFAQILRDVRSHAYAMPYEDTYAAYRFYGARWRGGGGGSRPEQE